MPKRYMSPERAKKARARAKAWYNANADLVLAKHREYIAANRESYRAYRHAYYLRHRDAILHAKTRRYCDMCGTTLVYPERLHCVYCRDDCARINRALKRMGKKNGNVAPVGQGPYPDRREP